MEFVVFLLQLIDGEVLCVHGGLSPEIKTIDQVKLNICFYIFQFAVDKI